MAPWVQTSSAIAGAVVSISVIVLGTFRKRKPVPSDLLAAMGSFGAAWECSAAVWLFLYGASAGQNGSFPTELQGFQEHLCFSAVAAFLFFGYGIWTCFANAFRTGPKRQRPKVS